MPFKVLQLQIEARSLNDSRPKYLQNLEIKVLIQYLTFDVSRFHSDRPNWSFEPTICPVAESCTLSALHNSTSGQITAQLISYSAGNRPFWRDENREAMNASSPVYAYGERLR